jgi:NADP-dependent 3-hydroxy acid dehydrogenase YdfG
MTATRPVALETGASSGIGQAATDPEPKLCYTVGPRARARQHTAPHRPRQALPLVLISAADWRDRI